MWPSGQRETSGQDGGDRYRTLADFAVASEPGNERVATRWVAAAVRELALSPPMLERLATAVGEATMNAMEHGNAYRPEAPVRVRVIASAEELVVQITDQGGGDIPPAPLEPPDMAAKLEGKQSARGWGLFLIRSMVDDLHVATDGALHTVGLVLRLTGDEGGPTCQRQR